MIEAAREKIIVALDVATEREAIELVSSLKDHVGMFKIGLELFTAQGPGIVAKITGLGARVFLDLKFKDIPNTVAGASAAAARLKVSMFNVHAMGGLAMMRSAVQAAGEESLKSGIERPLVLGVTMLTSIDQMALNTELRIPGSIEDHVVHLAKLAEQAGLDGVIASPREIKAIRNNVSPDMLIITPGVRPVWAESQDQKRIMTPGEAVKNGANFLVIGRPITRPPREIGTPVDAARNIAEGIARVLEQGGI